MLVIKYMVKILYMVSIVRCNVVFACGVVIKRLRYRINGLYIVDEIFVKEELWWSGVVYLMFFDIFFVLDVLCCLRCWYRMLGKINNATM